MKDLENTTGKESISNSDWKEKSMFNCSICAALADVMTLAQHGAHHY